MNFKKAFPVRITAIAAACLAFSALFTALRVRAFVNAPASFHPQENPADADIRQLYPQPLVSPLPYSLVPPDLFIHAHSAVLIDAANGCILYEKNADEIIPPASMTKLFVMYIAMQEIEAGRAAFSDVVPLPPECWAVNMPPDSSLMFLAEGQIVTLEELLTGLAVASGNDAAAAVAHYFGGTVSAFVERMNEEARKLGLQKTHFEEPSGYSEKNVTTAREFSAFARVYISRFPYALEKFHARKMIAFPQEHNLPQHLRGNGAQPIVQYNTNKLLGKLAGADGLKTGFIYESKYNLALTAERNGTRYISITMLGPGENSAEGNAFRLQDGTALMEWAFAGFHSAQKPDAASVLPVFGAKGKTRAVRLVPANGAPLTVPHIAGTDAETPLAVHVSLPSFLNAPVAAGTEYGTATYMLGSVPLETVPLVAERSAAEGNPLKKAADAAARLFFRLRFK
ncbi:MAG: D-alanyl-D-alanine carboxypeptidase [Bacteroides sp.]|nr:D-alanyl-D-alanine carboxypeptidase [Prevotella sp.]MCM1408244.1 D-alanyl-D-alanine carboxypeptidase [Treponema brennaborense]MCM1469568.1 D-alanyl-D-alanine carboxypeptidase [Bacteroides sp.]